MPPAFASLPSAAAGLSPERRPLLQRGPAELACFVQPAPSLPVSLAPGVACALVSPLSAELAPGLVLLKYNAPRLPLPAAAPGPGPSPAAAVPSPSAEPGLAELGPPLSAAVELLPPAAEPSPLAKLGPDVLLPSAVLASLPDAGALPPSAGPEPSPVPLPSESEPPLLAARPPWLALLLVLALVLLLPFADAAPRKLNREKQEPALLPPGAELSLPGAVNLPPSAGPALLLLLPVAVVLLLPVAVALLLLPVVLPLLPGLLPVVSLQLPVGHEPGPLLLAAAELGPSPVSALSRLVGPGLGPLLAQGLVLGLLPAAGPGPGL